MQIPLLFTQFLKGNELNKMWHMIQITINAYLRQFLKKIFISMCPISVRMLHVNHAWELHVNQDSHTECCMLTMHGSHTLIKILTLNPAHNPCMGATR